jgi:hypothetical protein
MTIVIDLEAANTAADDAIFSTDSITVPSGAVLYVGVAIATSGSATSDSWVTPTALGGTWTKIHGEAYGSRRAAAVWRGVGCSGTGAIAFEYNGGGNASVNVVSWMILSALGLDVGTPDDGAAEAVTGAATALNPTVTGTGAAGDATVSWMWQETNEALGQDAGWAELVDQGETSGIRRMGLAWDADGDTTPSWTWATSGAAYGVSLRLKSGGGVDILDHIDHHLRIGV